MRIDDKRKVIEALLCASADANNTSLDSAAISVDCPWCLVAEAIYESYRADPVSKLLRVSQRDARQAYRLIESSPTLRREWFGR